MSNDGSGHDPIIPFLWGALFASGSKSSSNASAGGGIVILILLAIVSVPLMPIILVAGVSVRALTIFGVHPVLIALTACAFAYWAFVLAGLIYRYLPVVISALLTAIYLTGVYTASVVFVLADNGNSNNTALNEIVAHGNFSHVDWVWAAVIILLQLIAGYFIGKYVARWMKAGRKQSIRAKLIVSLATIILVVLDLSPLLMARADPDRMLQIGSEGAVVVTADTTYIWDGYSKDFGAKAKVAGGHTTYIKDYNGRVAYGRGDDYVSQTTAARKDHKQRQEALNGEFRSGEITERLQRLRDRLTEQTDAKAGTDHNHDAGPNRQPEAPSGGHTRSR